MADQTPTTSTALAEKLIHSNATYINPRILTAVGENNQSQMQMLAEKVKRATRKSGEDQSVLFIGPETSYKTSNALTLLQQLTRKKPQIYTAAKLLSYFSTVGMKDNRGASRAGILTEIQYDGMNQVSGAKFVDYLLDKRRASSQQNFRIFSCLFSAELKNTYGLSEHHKYNYYAPEKHNKQESSARTAEILSCMKAVGFSSNKQHAIFSLLSAILYLGNIEFKGQEGEPASIKHGSPIQETATLLQVTAKELEDTLLFKSKVVKKELCTVYLTSAEACQERDALAETLYSLLFTWLVERMNIKMCHETPANFIAIVDVVGSRSSSQNNFYEFCSNYATEKYLDFINRTFYTANNLSSNQQRIMSNSANVVDMIQGPLLEILDVETLKSKPKDSIFLGKCKTMLSDEQAFNSSSRSNNTFSISHYNQKLTYDVTGFVDANSNSLSSDFATLFKNNESKSFAKILFSQQNLVMQNAPRNDVVGIVAQSSKPTRQPSQRIRKSRSVMNLDALATPSTVLKQLVSSLDELFASIGETSAWLVYCFNGTKGESLRELTRSVLMKEISDYSLDLVLEKKLLWNGDARSSNGSEKSLAGLQHNLVDGRSVYSPDAQSAYFSVADMNDHQSICPSMDTLEDTCIQDQAQDEYTVDLKITDPSTLKMQDLGKGKASNSKEEVVSTSKLRKYWVGVVWLMTFWIPTSFMSCCGKMKRSDVRQAWREKVALCFLILMISAVAIFLIAGLGPILCPSLNQYSPGELSNHAWEEHDVWVAVHGQIYDYTHLARTHTTGPERVYEYAGKDASELFYRDPSLCGLTAKKPYDHINSQNFDHNPEASLSILNRRNKKIWKGSLAYKRKWIAEKHANSDSWWIIIDKRVYNLTRYKNDNENYYGDVATNIIYTSPGQDVTNAFMDSPEARQALRCMDAINYVGTIDTRDSPQCLLANYLLLSATGILVAIMVFKFLAALQLGSRREPEEHDKFVVCQVPCYTETEESLKKTLDSLAVLKYDDKRKLLFVIADGMIIGSGNDRPTPRIVLDILGVDPNIDPEPLSFHSVGEGNKQHNMGKIYTGLYDCAGHLVPFIMVAKVGKPSERSRPGNRGKRDSQLLVMRFFSKVHYNHPMSPLELEMYHHIKNVIGVDPSYYEFVLMVDADTEVSPDSLNRMVSNMTHDTRIMGICGETSISNERDSWVTMIQVYEYYISHHLAKAFESLFGSVTCLPGCFCMYRLRSAKGVPLLIAPPIIDDYSENSVDTLHKKNLLSLGEDRYLTTLMMKHFPSHKTSFTQDATCLTVAPDRWSVLLSQRRRWINSTVHNLAELLLLKQMCGFCCFSLRFIVIIDLFATLIMPATIGYLGYLIYLAVMKHSFPIISLILLAAAYGLQVIIFIIKRQWQHIGWMIIYIIAMPVFSFFIPLYSFWHFDDFSWGNTRKVIGEKGGKKLVVDEEPFQPESIPLRTWKEHEDHTFRDQADHLSQISYSSGNVLQAYPPNVSMYQPYTPYEMSMPPQPEYYSVHPSQEYMHTSYDAFESADQMTQSVLPTDDAIVDRIEIILQSSDLMSLTKKQVREELRMFFGVDLSSRREFINAAIEAILQQDQQP